MSQQNNQKNHNLNNAGNVLGSMYNTNQYSENYKEKKGMKFFVIMIIIITVASALILLIKPYPTLRLVQADQNGLTTYIFNIDVFGRYDIVTEKYYAHSTDSFTYMGLEGIEALTASTAASFNADFLVADKDILENIAAKLTLKNSTSYLNIIKADTDSMLENTLNSYYGLPASVEFEPIKFNNDQYIAVMPITITMTDRQMYNVLKKMSDVYD